LLTKDLTLQKLAKQLGKPADFVLSTYKSFVDRENLKLYHTVDHEEAETYIFGWNGFPVKQTKGILPPRPPVITIMGHVDHGKTTLLDSFRNSNVCATEFGGITQGIGAFSMKTTTNQKITFLDTPGHEAFSNMRSRGAQVTDIVVLVVSAVEGVQQQTIEALNHALDAKVPIIAAINKIDADGANPKKVERQLNGAGLKLDQFGGDSLHVSISAKKKINLDKLEEAMLFQAELMELKADKSCPAQGTVIESKMKHGRGSVCTVLIQRGTLKVGDVIVMGAYTGRVKAMTDDTGASLKSAGPSDAVELTGIREVPEAGEIFISLPSMERAKEIANYRNHVNQIKQTVGEEKHEVAQLPKLEYKVKKEFMVALKSGKLNDAAKVLHDGAHTKKSGEELEHQLMDDAKKEEDTGLRIILKAENRGMLEALEQSVLDLAENEGKDIEIIKSGIGDICDDDIDQAKEFDAAILTMNVGMRGEQRDRVEKERIVVKIHKLIYHLIDDVLLMSKANDPVVENVVVSGTAIVRKVYDIDTKAKIKPRVAGLEVTSGTLRTRCLYKVLRNSQEIAKNLQLDTLRRFKVNVKEATRGQECGLALINYYDFKEEDVIQAYELARASNTAR